MALRQPSQSIAPPRASRPIAERRRVRRTRVGFCARIRPIHDGHAFLEEVCKTLNVSRSGIYFSCGHASYRPNMHLYVSCPDSGTAFDRAAEMARVVRVDSLAGGKWGVAVNYLNSAVYHPAPQRDCVTSLKGVLR
jgi:hypothetical protein